MTTITITAETIAKLEAAGFKRWTKSGMDRLYIDATKLGLEVSYYKTGNVSNADARRLLSSKVWIDAKTGELHVRTDYYNGTDEDMTLESVAAAYVEGIVAEPEEESEGGEDEAAADARDAWDGEGHYRIGWSDGGMDWTSDGPVWYETEGELAEELGAAYADATDTHLPYAEKVSPTTFATKADAIEWVDLTLSTSEGYPDDYDMDAIAEEVTAWQDGRLVLTALDDDLFWDIVRRHDRTNRTKAEFRAMRETLGVTQQRLADDLGVRVLSVKRWESPRYPQCAPGEAWGLLDDLMAVQDGAVEAAVAQARQEAEGTRLAVLPYWSSQSDYAEHHDGAAGSDTSWTEANATSRRVAAVLRGLGYEVHWVDGRDGPAL